MWWSSVPNLVKVSTSLVKVHERQEITTIDLLLRTKGWLKWRGKDLFCRLMETKVNYKHVTIMNLDFRQCAAPFGWYTIHALNKLIFDITYYPNYDENDGRKFYDLRWHSKMSEESHVIRDNRAFLWLRPCRLVNDVQF